MQIIRRKKLSTAKECIRYKDVTVQSHDKKLYNGYLQRLSSIVTILYYKAKCYNNIFSWDISRHERNFYYYKVCLCNTDCLQKNYQKFDYENFNPTTFFIYTKSVFQKSEDSSIPPV